LPSDSSKSAHIFSRLSYLSLLPLLMNERREQTQKPSPNKTSAANCQTRDASRIIGHSLIIIEDITHERRCATFDRGLDKFLISLPLSRVAAPEQGLGIQACAKSPTTCCKQNAQVQTSSESARKQQVVGGLPPRPLRDAVIWLAATKHRPLEICSPSDWPLQTASRLESVC
jgi:hypothetical protein